MNKNYKKINVEVEIPKPESLLNTYKKLLSIRRESNVLRKGDIRLLDDPNGKVLAYFRIYKKNRLLVLLNFKNEEVLFDLDKHTHPKIKASLVYSTNLRRQEGENIDLPHINLTPNEGMIIKFE